jgi:signal transduction histidine kinase
VSVLDKGCEFDMKELNHKDGLGIRSMGERVRLLGGEFEIRSTPGKGTTVSAWVPLAPNSFGGFGLSPLHDSSKFFPDFIERCKA